MRMNTVGQKRTSTLQKLVKLYNGLEDPYMTMLPHFGKLFILSKLGIVTRRLKVLE